jgi:ribosomal protein S18 acetylase RimI-like enzyme
LAFLVEEEMQIRVAGPDDAGEVARLLEAFNGPPVSVEQARGRLIAAQGVETALLAEVEGRAVGFAAVRVVPYLSDDVPYAELTELYVEAAHRRRGVGQALLGRAAAIARERGAAELLLLTGLENRAAQAFYRAMGCSDFALAMSLPLGEEET